MSEAPEIKRPRIQAPDGSGDQNDVYELPKISDEDAKNLLEKLSDIQEQVDKVNEQASEEILQVEQKYNKVRRPHYENRAEFIEKLPNFWVTALMNHSSFCDLVNEEEEECLRFLKNLDILEADDVKSGCQIIFTFYPNRFFENETITKEFDMQDWEAKVKTTEIKWKISRPDKKTERTFFNWLEGNYNDEDLLDVLREDIWPNPVYHFSACEGAAEEPSSESENTSGEEELDNEAVPIDDEDSEE